MSERDHWFEELADHLGAAYDRYAHTKGTVQEIDHIVAALRLTPGQRVLDVGCGTGRHGHELARRGIEVHGIDISQRFIDLASAAAPPSDERDVHMRPLRSSLATAPPSDERDVHMRPLRSSLATFERGDARSMAFDAEFDAVICLCQGAFGMMTSDGEDDAVVAGMARALKPGGRLALSAFNAYFAVKYHGDADFDAATGVSHELTEIRSETGESKEVELWTGCYTPRELRLLLARHDLALDSIASVEPGAYGDAPPTTESPEFLALATRAATRKMPEMAR